MNLHFDAYDFLLPCSTGQHTGRTFFRRRAKRVLSSADSSPGSYVWTEGWDQWRPCEDAFEWFISSAKLPPLPPHSGSEGTTSHSNTSSAHAEQHEKAFSPDEMKASTAKEYRSLSDWMQNHEILNQIHRWGLKKLNIGYKSWKLSYYTAIGTGLFFLILIGMLNHRENNDDIVSWENARTQRQISNELQDQRLRQMAQQAIMYNNRIQAEREANKIETCNRCRSWNMYCGGRWIQYEPANYCVPNL